MKRLLLAIIVAVLIAASAMYAVMREYKNPDPSHTHADFAVWVNGAKLDFTDPRYMSEAYDPESGSQIRVDPLRKFLHLHDGNGHVIHRHKPGLTLGEFFASLGMPMSADCLMLDDHQFAALDKGWVESFAITNELCGNGKFHWQMYVNGRSMQFNPGYVFNDGDKILLIYGASDVHEQELQEMTDDACLYSRTCPFRGKPPTENCIADPSVPCVLPE